MCYEDGDVTSLTETTKDWRKRTHDWQSGQIIIRVRRATRCCRACRTCAKSTGALADASSPPLCHPCQPISDAETLLFSRAT